MELVFLALLILLMALALGSGYPVAFALPGSAILAVGAAAAAGWLFAGSPDAYFASGGPSQWLSAGVTNLRGVYWEAERDTLIAIPLFIFMGIMLQRSRIAEDLLVTMAQLFGPIPGGLGISVVFVGALLAATTGIVGATVVAMGLISLPAMLRNNYSKPLATGTIAASGTLGQIIPPSIVLIILADQLSSAVDQAGTARKALYKAATGELSMPSDFDVASTSAGEMFLGAFVPGLVLVGLYMAFILVFALLNPKKAPAVPYEGDYDARFWGKVAITLVPPLALIFLVLGSIIAGVATVNQAGAIGAAGALVMAGYRLETGPRAYAPAILFLISLAVAGFAQVVYAPNIKNIQTPDDQIGVVIALIGSAGLIASLVWSGARALRIDNTLQGVMVETAKTSALVFIILMGAAMLTAAFRGFGGEHLVQEFLESLPGGFWMQFFIVMMVIFILGFFLDFIEIAVVVVPIVAPILLADPAANVTAVWLGVMIGLNIQTSFLTPPFGFALFYLRGVAPAAVRTIEIYKGVIAFIALQLVALGIVGFYPPLANYLPTRVSLTSETAPPPRNPKLQLCLEEYVAERLAHDADRIRAVADALRAQDLSYLPSKLAKDLTAGLDKAEEAIALLGQARKAAEAVAAAAPAYRPVHDAVRTLEKDIRRLDEEADRIRTRLSRLRPEDGDQLKPRLEARLKEIETERAALAARIPADWPEVYKAFHKLDQAEKNARAAYRRAADQSYEAAAEIKATLAATEALRALAPDLRALAEAVAANEPAEMVEPVTEMRSRLGDVEGAGAIRSAVSKARSALRARTPDKAEAIAQMQAALNALEADLAWRERALAELAPALDRYEAAIRDTLGARQQPRLTREQALFIASCSADHRDISLSF
ncbi:TRAP transporter large permease subunit [Oceanicella actignis]|uniref:TRAP transporter, DctM subunit n=1 Tax=Oceanicella actignis TaxID=1189325 RepID=A0A1M7T100_9RHOB|nr:TRAP transporter large permease subunit [Oceanicella actignis]SET37315.1 TRAP transporter, DctM subunit [Oceanicella actignis]SHN64433.1 TRAP transporter, DctM subunit [Oceanicella actignis]